MPDADPSGPVLVVRAWEPPGQPSDPALRSLNEFGRFAMLARAASALDLSGIDQLRMLAAGFCSIAMSERENPDVAPTLALARILKALDVSIRAADLSWLSEQATRAKVYLESRGGDFIETRPQVAVQLRYYIAQRLEDGATDKDALEVAETFIDFLFQNFRQASLPINADIPEVPTREAIQNARTAALAGAPKFKRGQPFDLAEWEAYQAGQKAFRAEVLRRDPWAFWPEAMRPRCEKVRKRMTRVLLDRPPTEPHEVTAERLVCAGLRALDYPDRKVRSLFASRGTN